jgi:hypothetical protein
LTPTQLLLDAALDLLAADTATLAPIVGNKVGLVIAPFTPGPDTDVGDLTLATFTGSAPKVSTAGAPTVAYDPVEKVWYIRLNEPAGGWEWVCTVAPATPETVYGLVYYKTDASETYGAQLLDTPVEIAAVSDSVFVGRLVFRASSNWLF